MTKLAQQLKGADMARTTSTRARQAAVAAVLAVLSALPYTIVYGIDRALEVPHAARAALWPTVVVPVLVAALLAVQFVGGRSSQQARLATVQLLGQREHERAA